MRKLIASILVVFAALMLYGCKDGDTLDFNATIPTELEVDDSFTVSIKDLEDNQIDASKITVAIKSGDAFVTLSGLTLTGLSAGSVTITITYADKDLSVSKDFTFIVVAKELTYGLPQPKLGYYMKDADIIQDGTKRILVYSSNAQSGEEDNIIQATEGILHDEGYVYGEAMTILEPSADGWDEFIGSPSIVKGEFNYGGTEYAYLMAYQGTDLTTENANSIGFAVSNNPLSGWIKVGTTPVLSYDREVYGEAYAGFYAPSLVNLNKVSIIRVFFTWADAYGHFTYFVDIDASNLNDMNISGFAMAPNNGNLSTGEDVTMIPNASFAYDATNHIFYMIKDYSPTPSREPLVATRIEFAKINEAELYTAEQLIGWQSLRLYDMFDTPDTMYERLYSGTLVKDAYGHILDVTQFEIIYNVSELEADNVDYIFSQQLMTFLYE